MKNARWLVAGAAALWMCAATADEVVLDDLIVEFSLCAGLDCEDGEVFDFDTLRLKSDDPAIRFEDTSNSSSFPTNDWMMGITDNAMSGPAQFYIRDLGASKVLLLLEAGESGGVALGADATIVAGAISVGTTGAERRVANVADAVADNDAVNMGQFTAFTADIDQQVQNLDIDNETDQIDAELADLRDRIADINARIDALLANAP